jgi:hypothetical protein
MNSRESSVDKISAGLTNETIPGRNKISYTGSEVLSHRWLWRVLLSLVLLPASCWFLVLHFRPMKICSSETLVDFHWNIRRYISEGRIIHERFSSPSYPKRLCPLHQSFRPVPTWAHSPAFRDFRVGIATGYGLRDRGVGVRITVGSRIFPPPRRPDRF